IDLAWKKDRQEMAELFEAFVVRLLDLLDRNPSLTYVLEQAAHFRQLAAARPDLISRVRTYVRAGRLEVVGGMASTMETNTPNGECFLRNQLLGLGWFRENLGTRPAAGWLIDTFGIHAQVPQVLCQLGIPYLFANRLGGTVDVTMVRARGLDGSEVPVIGRDVYSPYVKPGSLAFRHVQSWEQIQALFQDAARLSGTGPFLVVPYTENETLPSSALIHAAERMSSLDPAATWSFAVPSQLNAQVRDASAQWPQLDGDLNPEFTGTYAHRSIIRRRNRAVENKLLDAEKWLSLLSAPGWGQDFEECWWKMAFVHFHDVFTGSHPTKVRDQVLTTLDEVESTVAAHRDPLLSEHCRVDPSAGGRTLFVANSLPWERRDVQRLELPDGIGVVQRVASPEGDVPFWQNGRQLWMRTALPSMGIAAYRLELGDAPAAASADAASITSPSGSIENRLVRASFRAESGLAGITLRGAGVELCVCTGVELVAQQDDGNFQIEDPVGSEIPASSGVHSLRLYPITPLGQRATVHGAFPELPWSPGSSLQWEAEVLLPVDSDRLELGIRLRWRGEGTRIRLRVQTPVETSSCIQEVPFGTVRRRPYRDRGTARGEWPVQRFVALEDHRGGLALINRGTVGVEAAGGTLWTTLLRAPVSEYAGMVPDDTSSQHGEHEFHFTLVPYSGSWHEAGIHRAAAEANSPPVVLLRPGRPTGLPIASLLRLDAATVMLSTVKAASDGSGEIVARLYETAGIRDRAVLEMDGAEAAWDSTLEELRGSPLACEGQRVVLDLRPFEIRTIRIRKRYREIERREKS
ncbi:MAG TPA: glycoside hydrolase family 38 C-terminal domain-containing protein, partial [Spirochaetia bacterium]|nr:glycoside hydrolase family 38 C-terminal domain-containing protein [Spirochaetia bacterium]